MFTTNKTGRIKFQNMLQIWTYANLYQPGIIEVNDNGVIKELDMPISNWYKSGTLITTIMKNSLRNELLKFNKISDTFGTVFERYYIVRNRSLPLGYMKILESECADEKILKRAYFPEKHVLKYFLQIHDWQLQ